MAGDATVLVVDDEPRLVDLYATFLGDRYTVRTATGGEEAFESMDGTVDVLVVDRRMPGLSGDEFIEIVRRRGFDGFVLVITGVDAGLDIVSIPLDEYLTKPTPPAELLDRIDALLELSTYDEDVREYAALATKRRALERSVRTADLAESDDYAALRDRLDRLAERIDPSPDELVDDLVDRPRSGVSESPTS